MTISRAEWGYVESMADWSGGRAADAANTGHKFAQSGDRLLPGVPDKTVLGDFLGGYGRVKPWDPKQDGESLVKAWKLREHPRVADYYIALLNGCPDVDAVQLYYPERLIISAEGCFEKGEEVPSRQLMLDVLDAAGIPSRPSRWDPCQVFTGISNGIPAIKPGLKANTDLGISWYEASRFLQSEKLPERLHWEWFAGDDKRNIPAAKYGILYYDL